MASTKQLKYNQIPQLSKVSVPVTLKAGLDASSVTVTLTIPSGLSLIGSEVSSGTFDGTDTWTLASVSDATSYTATFDFVTTTQYSGPLTVVATLSNEAGDQLTEDNVLNVVIMEDADVTAPAPAVTDGLSIYNGTEAQHVPAYLSSNGGSADWVIAPLVYEFSVASTGDLSGLSVSLPAAIVDLIDAGTIEAIPTFSITTSGVYVTGGAVVATTGVASNDGTASSASIEFDNSAVLAISDGSAFSGTVAGKLILNLVDASAVASAL